MKKITLIFLALIISGAAIAKQKKHKKQVAGNNIIFVQLSHTGCFGRCPTYSIEINKDGMATYNAIRFNTDSGVFNKNIGVAKAMNILNEVSKYQLDTCKDLYENRVSDLPGINFMVQYTGKTKNIYNAKYGPAFLQLIARDIDAVGKKADSTGWKRAVPAGK